MNLLSSQLHLLLGELEWKAVTDFDDVSDYVYKSPRLLTHEKNLERRKLAVYFPEVGIDAEIRSHYESVKLNETFPRLIAMGNLFLVLSVFENYVFDLLKLLQDHNPVVPKLSLSRGVAEHLKATKAYGAEPYEAKYYEQVLTAISIRNCLMHAKGLLASSRQADALRTRISHCKFLSSDLKKRRSEREGPSARSEVTIEGTGVGERLVVTNDYAHLACHYLGEYFCALCGTLNPNAALRPVVHHMDPRDLALNRAHQGPNT